MRTVFCWPPDHIDPASLPGEIITDEHPDDDYPDAWRRLAREPADTIFVPLTEEGVLLCADLNQRHGHGLQLDAALASVSRRMMLDRLTEAGLRRPTQHPHQHTSNPKVVLKAGASVHNSGVLVSRLHDITPGARAYVTSKACAALARLRWHTDNEHLLQPVLEDFIAGEQYELSGFVGLSGRATVLSHMRQVWAETGWIRDYVPIRIGPHQRELAQQAVDALGLRGCGFIVEYRGEQVIEVNARLGEDGPLYDRLAADAIEEPTLFHRLVGELSFS